MNDSQLVTIVRHLVCTENVPTDITPLDRLQVIRLLVQHAAEENVYTSQDVLASQLGVAVPALARSQKRLKQHGWIAVHSGGYHRRTNRYSVQLDKLPIADLQRTIVTEDARKLAAGYAKYLRKTERKRLWQGWEQQAAFVCQGLIEKADNDLQIAMNGINFALHNTRYRKAALKGPRGLRRNWKQILAEYQAQKTVEGTTQ